MKVMLLNGSPHANGCVYTALMEIANTLKTEGVESTVFQLGNKPVRGCVGCGGCQEKGHCVFPDPQLEAFLAEMATCDALVIGSPVYYAGPNGSLCAFLDRAFYSGTRFFAGKFGAAVVNCRRGGASAAFDRLNKYFTILSMPVVSSQYWNSTHGFTPEDVRKDLEGLQTMRTLARNLAQLLRDRAANGNILTLPKEEWTPTHFIR